MRRLFLVALLTALTPGMNAQRVLAPPPHFAPIYNRSGHPHLFFYRLAYSDPFYSDDLSSSAYPAASQPPVVIVQASPAPRPGPEQRSVPAEPLMIELQGDHYVRVSGDATSPAPGIDPMPDSAQQPRRMSDSPAQALPTAALPPSVLVFRDGHREEISDYTIADGVLYTRSDYYATGSWNKKIELSSLNLPETVKFNQARGLHFHFPAAANEVIVGP
jgi:hypothetical protein